MLQKDKEKIPSPDKYTIKDDFLKKTKIPFNKTAKVSIYEEIAKRKQSVPSPNTYNIVQKDKSRGYYYDKKNERPSFTDDVVYNEQATPSQMYLPKLDLVKPKATISKMSGPKSNRLEKIQKNDNPAPTSYDSLSCQLKFKANHNFSYSFSKKKLTFLDGPKNSGPPVGTYDLSRGEKFLTKGVSKGWK